MTSPPGITPAPGSAAPTQAQLNMRIPMNSPDFPKELWGKTIAEAMRFYGIMRQDFIQRNDPAAQPPAAATPPATPPAAPPAPTYRPPAAAAPASTDAFADIDARISAALATAIPKAMAPMAAASAQQVYEKVAAAHHDWHIYDAAIRESVAGAAPQDLMNPELWKSAYYFAKGKALSEGDAPAAVTPVPSNGNRPIITPPPPPPTHETYFTERPSAPPPPSNTPNDGLSPTDPNVIRQAIRWGISPEDYIRAARGDFTLPARA